MPCQMLCKWAFTSSVDLVFLQIIILGSLGNEQEIQKPYERSWYIERQIDLLFNRILLYMLQYRAKIWLHDSSDISHLYFVTVEPR